ncbi:MAG: SdpI family protein [Bowdeniella nasicola]|nr:SdpI family protein [Bowdeniella nasicola]
MNPLLILGIPLILIGVTIVGLGAASKAERLPINSIIGIRIPSTMVDNATWIRSHRAAWAWICIAGLGLTLAGVLVLATKDESGLWAMSGTAWLLAFIGIATAVASHAARNVTETKNS